MKLFTALFLGVAMGAHAQVRIDTYGDTLTGNIKRMTEYSLHTKDGGNVAGYIKPDTVKSIYTCDTINHTELIRFYNEQDKETTRELMQFDSKGHILEAKSYTDLDSLCKRCTYKYDAYGRQIEKREITYPFHGSYPPEEVEVSTVFNDSLGDCIKYTYDSMGRIAEKIDESVWDSKTTTDQIDAYKYDAKGNKIEEYNLNLRLCGVEDKYFLFYFGGRGYATKTVFKYDGSNRLAERTEYSEQKMAAPFPGNRHSGTLIGRKTVYNFSAQEKIADNLSVMSLYWEADSSVTAATPMTLPNWAGKTNETLEHDKQGNVTKKMKWNQFVFRRTIEYF